MKHYKLKKIIERADCTLQEGYYLRAVAYHYWYMFRIYKEYVCLDGNYRCKYHKLYNKDYTQKPFSFIEATMKEI